jgi:hypothetical protein
MVLLDGGSINGNSDGASQHNSAFVAMDVTPQSPDPS